MLRQPAATDPPTFTAGEVVRILHGQLSEQSLGKWDESGIFRPTFYADAAAGGGLITTDLRDASVALQKTRGAPRRRYTFLDLVWLRLLLHVKDQFARRHVPNPARRASEVIGAMRATHEQTPAQSRLLFLKEDVYLVEVGGEARCLTDSTQLPLTALFTSDIAAEVRGRVEILRARNELAAETTTAADSRMGAS